jgi:hypothetical protein
MTYAGEEEGTPPLSEKAKISAAEAGPRLNFTCIFRPAFAWRAKLGGRTEECGVVNKSNERHGRHYFSGSISPLTNQRCIRPTTAIGGSNARRAVAMTRCQAV